jgi:hypothetical protein
MFRYYYSLFTLQICRHRAQGMNYGEQIGYGDEVIEIELEYYSNRGFIFTNKR